MRLLPTAQQIEYLKSIGVDPRPASKSLSRARPTPWHTRAKAAAIRHGKGADTSVRRTSSKTGCALMLAWFLVSVGATAAIAAVMAFS